MRPVALSIRNEDLQADRIFDLPPDGPFDRTPYIPWQVVRERGRQAGLDLMTADRVAERGIDPRSVTVISYDWPPATDLLVGQGARLGVLTSLEPPVIAWELYYTLPTLSARFPHVFLFGGAAKRVAPTATFHPLRFPQVRQARPSAGPDWHARRFLVSISSNKAIVRSFMRWFDQPREVSVKRELATRFYSPIGQDLYLERLRAVEYFASHREIDVFGYGWERRHPAVPRHLHEVVQRAHRGPMPGKLETMANYKFALCFENSRFDGYVSEKIFDCFFSRTIPIYLGAPDIRRYVPPETFVDVTRFPKYRDLEQYLERMDRSTMERYLEAADAYLRSPAFEQFSVECFAEKLVRMLVGGPPG